MRSLGCDAVSIGRAFLSSLAMLQQIRRDSPAEWGYESTGWKLVEGNDMAQFIELE